MTIDFYYNPMSAPSRTVLLAAEAIGVELNKKILDLKEKKEQLNPEFLKINPQHTVPTIHDNGFALAESRAIITYLQNQYGKNDSLYPKDQKKRAVVDQRLYFDIGLFSELADCFFTAIRQGRSVDPEKKEKFEKTLKIFDDIVGNTKFAAGDNFTLADISLVVTLSSLELVDYNLQPYKNISKWYALVKKTAPGYKELNEENLILVKNIFSELTKKK